MVKHRGHSFGPWSWDVRFFERGELPLALLSLLLDEPRHGYEMMKLLETRTDGLYAPSAGTIYPAMQQLQDQGFVRSAEIEGGKRTYTLTDEGRQRLVDEADTVDLIWERANNDEWLDWGDAMAKEANEVIAPAFRLMRSAVKAVNHSRTPQRIEDVRNILHEARAQIRALKQNK